MQQNEQWRMYCGCPCNIKTTSNLVLQMVSPEPPPLQLKYLTFNPSHLPYKMSWWVSLSQQHSMLTPSPAPAVKQSCGFIYCWPAPNSSCSSLTTTWCPALSHRNTHSSLALPVPHHWSIKEKKSCPQPQAHQHMTFIYSVFSNSALMNNSENYAGIQSLAKQKKQQKNTTQIIYILSLKVCI